eukprot:jgi/Bigna1/89754/estExt_fgenesh1_pg.C_550022
MASYFQKAARILCHNLLGPKNGKKFLIVAKYLATLFRAIDAIVMNFFVVAGLKDVAKAFRKDSGLKPEVPLESMQDRMEIREEVFKGDIKRVIEKLNALNPEILKNQPDLDFMLQQQYFIELVREKGPDKIEECLDFARRELAPRAAENEQSLGEMERVMALLAFPDPANSAVGDLLSYDRREKVISALNTAILNSQSQSKDPKILKILRQLVFAQKQLQDKIGCQFPMLKDFKKSY